jgi:hypothetical protein
VGGLSEGGRRQGEAYDSRAHQNSFDRHNKLPVDASRPINNGSHALLLQRPGLRRLIRDFSGEILTSSAKTAVSSREILVRALLDIEEIRMTWGANRRAH